MALIYKKLALAYNFNLRLYIDLIYKLYFYNFALTFFNSVYFYGDYFQQKNT